MRSGRLQRQNDASRYLHTPSVMSTMSSAMVALCCGATTNCSATTSNSDPWVRFRFPAAQPELLQPEPRQRAPPAPTTTSKPLGGPRWRLAAGGCLTAPGRGGGLS